LVSIVKVVSEKKRFETFSPAFFSEITNMIKAKLYVNVHWMVLYKLYVFCSDMKFKMAAPAGLSLTIDPMGKCSNAFFSETTNIIKAKLYMNVHWMVLGGHLGFPIGIKNIGSDVKLSPAGAAILNFISEQKTLRL
jgi:hypothetical protein